MTILDATGRAVLPQSEQDEMDWLMPAMWEWLQDRHVCLRIMRARIAGPGELSAMGTQLEAHGRAGKRFEGPHLVVWHRTMAKVLANKGVRLAITRCILERQVTAYQNAQAELLPRIEAAKEAGDLQSKLEAEAELKSWMPNTKAKVLQDLLALGESMAAKRAVDESPIIRL